MAEVVMIDLAHVAVDGNAAGSVLDVRDNYPSVDGIKSLTLAAMQSWLDARDQAHADELAAAIKAGEDAVAAARAECNANHAAAAEKLTCDHAEAISGFQSTIAKLNAQATDYKTQIEALGGTELGQQMAKAAAIRVAEDAVAKANADLAALNATT